MAVKIFVWKISRVMYIHIEKQRDNTRVEGLDSMEEAWIEIYSRFQRRGHSSKERGHLKTRFEVDIYRLWSQQSG